MDREQIQFIVAVLRLRRVRLLLSIPISIVLGLVAARFYPSLYTATTRVFVNAPSSSSIAALRPGTSSYDESPGRTNLVMAQKALLESLTLYSLVKDALPEPKPPSALRLLLKGLKRVAKRIVVGHDSTDGVNNYDATYQTYLKSLIFLPDPASGSFAVGYRSSDASISVTVARRLAELLPKANRQINASRRGEFIAFLERKIRENQEKLRKSESELAEYARVHGVVPSRDVTSVPYRTLSELQARLTSKQVDLQEKELRLEETKLLMERLKTQIKKGVEKMNEPRARAAAQETQRFESLLLDESLQEPEREKIKERLAYLRTVTDSTAFTGSGTPEALQKALDQATAKKVEYESDLRIDREVYEGMRKNLKQGTGKLQGIPELELRLGRLVTERDEITKVIEVLTDHYIAELAREDGSFARLIPDTNVRLIADRPVIHKYYVFLMATLALIFGTALVTIALDQYRGSIVTVSQLASLPTAICLGTAGRFPHSSGDGLVEDVDSSPGLVHALTYLAKTASTERAKVILVYGRRYSRSQPQVALSLASVLADSRKEVLLIDGSFPRGKLSVSGFYPKSSPVHRRASSLADATPAATRGSVVLADFTSMTKGKAFTGPPARVLEPLLAKHRAQFDFIVMEIGGLPIFDNEPAFFELSDFVVICCDEGTSTIDDARHSIALAQEVQDRRLRLFTLLTELEIEPASLHPITPIGVSEATTEVLPIERRAS